MGNCTGSCTQSRKNTYKIKKDKYDKVPDDIQKYKNQNTIKRAFSALFANVKVKKCPYKSIGVKISIDQEQYYKLGHKSLEEGQDVKWKFQKKLDFMKTDYQIRKSFLVVQIIDQFQNVIATLRINLYLISIGPYHQDFMIQFKNKKHGRISFDFKISQLIQVSFQSLQAEINLIKKHPGQNFAFSIKTIIGNDIKISKPSYPVQVMVDQKLSNKYIQIQPKPKLPRRGSKTNLLAQQVKQLKQNKNLQWRKAECQQMPSISMKILLHTLHHSYFQILLIKYTQTLESSSDESDGKDPSSIIKQQLFAQCYISFHKLFSKQPQLFIKNDICYEKRYIQLQQKIWIHGRQSGKAKLSFYVQSQKYIKQMQVCVRTQEGISKTSPVFQFDYDKKAESCKQVDQLMKLSEQIQLNIIKLQQCQDGYFEMKRLKSQIQNYLSQMLPILQKTSKQSMILYSYSNPNQLIKAQKVFIDIGQKIAAYVQEQDQVIGQYCWLILISLIKRGQFRLSNIGFNQRQRKQIENNNPSKIIKQKLQVAIMYQQFMYKLLNTALLSLNYNASETQRTFAQIFCAYAYFRIPDFRNQMLNILSKQDLQVPQWRGIQFSLNQDIDYTVLREDVDSFTALFDWEHGFHKCLKFVVNKTQGKGDILQVQQILSNQNWKHRFQKRGSAFFSFIIYWVSYIQSVIIKSRDIQWKYFPGYNKLLKVFLIQLKKRNITEYSDVLKQTANRLIANQKIFSIVVYILLNKTNIYDPLTVIKSVQLISQLLQTLKRKNKSIPALFHYSHFLKGIQMILQSQFAFMIQATLIMIYSHFDMFHYQFKKNLCIFLLKRVFFKLFFHWSLNIRNVFHHLLIYRINKQIYHYVLNTNQPKGQKNISKYITNIRQHYQSTINSLGKVINENKLMKIVPSSQKNLKIQTELYKIMKKKLIQKKLSKAKKQLLQPKNVEQLINNEFPQSDNQNNPICVQKRRKQTLLLKPSYDQNLVQPRIDRTQSEIIKQNKVAIIYKNYKIQKKEEQVIQLNKENIIKLKNQILDTTQVRDDAQTCDNWNGKLKRQLNPIFNIFQQIPTELIPITQYQSQYIQKSMLSFDQITQIYNKSILQGRCQCPKIVRQQVSVDRKQIRPQKIDDW